MLSIHIINYTEFEIFSAMFSAKSYYPFQIDETRYIAALRVGDWKLNKGIDTYNRKVDLAFDFTNTLVSPENERKLSHFSTGTTRNGDWDGWFGPSGRNGSYDYNLVRQSPVSDALKKIGMPLKGDNKLKMLRAETEIKCAFKDDTEVETSCDIKNSVCLFNVKTDPCEVCIKVGYLF